MKEIIKHSIDNFGSWSIDHELFKWMISNIESDKIILELGSGRSSSEIVKIWKLYSIEENIDWVNKFHNNYIYAPLKDKWYSIDISKLPKKVDVILIDGPAHGDRIGFFENFSIFEKLEPTLFIFDDVDRPEDFNCYQNVLKLLNNRKTLTDVISYNKRFAYIKIIN